MTVQNAEQIVVRMPSDLLATLREVSAANERTVAATVRLAVRQHLDRRSSAAAEVSTREECDPPPPLRSDLIR